MGDRAEVSHQTRTSDDHALGLGYRMGDGYTRLQTTSTGLGPVRLLRRAPHLRCGAACFCRWPTSGGGWEGRRAGRRRYGEGAVCVSAPLMVGAYGTGRRTPRGRGHVVAGGDIFVRAGAFDAVGDGNPVPERVGCPRLERTAPRRADCPRRRLGCGRLRSPRKRAIGTSPAGPRWGSARSPAGGRGTRAVPVPIKDP